MNNGHVVHLAAFIERLARDVKPEPRTASHTGITRVMFSQLCGPTGVFDLPSRARVLDVGCGQGPALELFQACDFDATGIGIGAEDLAECRRKGFSVLEMDQSFLDFSDATFDLVWARHILEHSIAPYWTLSEFRRVMKPNGVLYAEVPAPGPPFHHEQNPNHYSVLPRASWEELIQRAGFKISNQVDINLGVQAYQDLYWGFIGRAESLIDRARPPSQEQS